jgi:hypothetical protein
MTNDTERAIRLHELVLENGRSASPFVWRVRYALAPALFTSPAELARVRLTDSWFIEAI